MRNETRELFNTYLDGQAELNGVDAGTVRAEKQFTIDPSIQQTLITKQQEASTFLQKINIVPVTEKSGEKLGLGVSGPIASRTNTAATDRAPVDPTTMDSTGYDCQKTNSDTFITYAKLDLWAKFPDFETRIRDNIINRQALDRIMIGFNGRSIAATSDKVANPLLQDVNKGWWQKYREFQAGARVLSTGKVANKVRVGTGANIDYANLHALVEDAKYGLMPSWAQEDDQLVVILGSKLNHDVFFPLINSNLVPTETQAAQMIISSKRVGGLAATKVPFVPANGLMITRLDNLSIYEQDGSRRRTVVDNAKRDRIETYESSNDDYVVEDFDYGCVVENIEIVAA